MNESIAFDGVSLRLAGRTVLDGFSLTVHRGDTLALLGRSGCGKTSVLRLALGLIAPDRGCVRLRGEVVSREGRVLRLPEERRLAVVFQDLALWPHLTVRGNLEFGLAAARVPPAERMARIAEIVRLVGIKDKEESYPGDLSGGERQRVAIARALVLDPEAVLLDEPLSNLDVSLKRELLRLFRDLIERRGATAIYVTHDPHEAIFLANRIAVMEQGQIIQEGTAAELASAPASEFVRELVVNLNGRPFATGRDEA
ncbi:MAG: ABC transporter ATP-binding protein [Candidatus Polarisedimenticolia bacterium]